MTSTASTDPVPSPTTLTTHVLDAARGRPASGLGVTLSGPGTEVSTVTDDDGRVHFDAAVTAGPHLLRFATGAWFAAAGRDTFYPEITVSFTVEQQPHYHVALLLSPFSYTTYRGS